MAMQAGPAALGPPHFASLVVPSSGSERQFLSTLTSSQRWRQRKLSFMQRPERHFEPLAALESLLTMEGMPTLLPTRAYATHPFGRHHFFMCLHFSFLLPAPVALCSFQGNTSQPIPSSTPQAGTGRNPGDPKARGSWRQLCPHVDWVPDMPALPPEGTQGV